jgi:hypothetical protein
MAGRGASEDTEGCRELGLDRLGSVPLEFCDGRRRRHVEGRWVSLAESGGRDE